MSDSVKLRFEHGIWCLIFSYVALIVAVVSVFLGVLIVPDFAILCFFSIMAFAFLLIFAIVNFSDAIKISKKEKV